MSVRFIPIGLALGAAALATGAAAPASARTVVSVGIGAPLYARPYRWYPGYYPPPVYYGPPAYYGPPRVVLRGYFGRPYAYRYGWRPRRYWRRW